MRGCPDCPRGLKVCLPLDNVISDDIGPKSFTCVGLNDGSDREIHCDYLTICVRAGAMDDDVWAIDSRDHVDRFDLGDQASVISTALAMDERISQQVTEDDMADVPLLGPQPNFTKFKQLREVADEEEKPDGKDTS